MKRELNTFATIFMAALVLLSFSQGLIYAQDEPQILQHLPGNGIGDMAWGANSTLWIASGGGVAKSGDFGQNWTFYTHGLTENFPRGSVSAMQVRGDTIWVATVFDTSTAQGDLSAGGGLGRSFDAGETWTYIPQPVDSQNAETVPYGDTTVVLNPTTTNVQNVTYDLAFEDSVIWITSWGGGIRQSTDYGETWQRIPTPMDNMDYLSPDNVPDHFAIRLVNNSNGAGNENQKGFSVIMDGNEVWVGTSGGINRSLDGGVTWRRYHFGNAAISGNWILALKIQQTGTNRYLWASTGQTFQGQESGISVFDYDQARWRTAKVVRFANNFTFDKSNNAVYAATDAGLFKSPDFGYTWETFGTIRDEDSGQPIFGAQSDRGFLYAISVLITPSPVSNNSRLWLGTTDGLGYTDNEYQWHVMRSFPPTSAPEVEDVYAYPNPFSPNRHNQLNGEGHVRIQYDMRATGNVTIRVYDFAMEKVADVAVNRQRSPGEWSETWDGRNLLGEIVANGVYFCKVTIHENDRTRTNWTKIMVING